jgi:hypothetical protein
MKQFYGDLFQPQKLNLGLLPRAVSIHRSVDGSRVVNYAQWESKEDFERMLQSPEAQGQIRQFAALAKSVSPAVYLVSSVQTS